ncbi:MAG: acyl carrier protein [Phycisphaerae bacterium]
MSQNLTRHIHDALVEALQIRADQIHDGLAMGVIPEWDSIAHVNLMFALETRLDIRIPVEQIPELISYRAIQDYLTALTTEATV